jgi:predicted kinase
MIIHVIGAVGAGKSYFIKNYLKEFNSFDIQSVYETHGINPSHLKNLDVYHQFSSALASTIENYFSFKDEPLVIESSGINKGLNRIIQRYTTKIILVHRKIPKELYQQRPYAEKLNNIIFREIANNRLKYDVRIDLDEEGNKKIIPTILSNFSI